MSKLVQFKIELELKKELYVADIGQFVMRKADEFTTLDYFIHDELHVDIVGSGTMAVVIALLMVFDKMTMHSLCRVEMYI